jgi:mannosyltransferase OCH1-like enzyme
MDKMRLKSTILLASTLLFLRLTYYLIAYGPRGPLPMNTLTNSLIYPYDTTATPTIHQSYKTSLAELPPLYQKWSGSWRSVHPDWKYKFWTDDANRELVVKHYPWFLKTYDSFYLTIFRVDSIRHVIYLLSYLFRYLYMHQYGGIYSDLDAECLQSLSPFFNDTSGVILAYMGHNRMLRHNIPNAFLGSTRPGNPFWIYIIKRIMREYGDYANAVFPQIPMFAEYLTGPIQLYESLKDYEREYPAEAKEIGVLGPEIVFPFDWYWLGVLTLKGGKKVRIRKWSVIVEQ